jgi:beta-glucanase (GH16 family)
MYRVLKSKTIITLFIALFSLSCKFYNSTVEDSYIYIQKNEKKNSDLKLVWFDNFNGSKLDTTKWSKVPRNYHPWGKYMTNDERCYKLSKGKLYLSGIVNDNKTIDSSSYLTGGIYSKNKFAFQYGKIKIRAKLECAQGAWPAIWMLAEQDKFGKYPHNGEIDIMEHLNFDSVFYQTTHSYYTLDLKQTDHPPHGSVTKVDISKFNTYGLEWTADNLIFSLNGVKTFEYPRLEGVEPSQWPYNQPFYLIIDQQLGGNWVGVVDPKDLPVRMIIDYVKVYQ